jgi:TetR/AcrR family transcriptional regulator
MSLQELSRSERRKARTAEAIVDAAERLFYERGYHRTSIQELADEADVAVGSIYAHFESKSGVYLALVDRAIAVDREYFADAFSSEGATPDQMARASGAFVRFYRERPALFRLFAWQGGPEDPSAEEVPAASKRLGARIEESIGRLSGVLERAIADGELRNVDPRATAKVMWAMLSGLMALHARGDRGGVDEGELDGLLAQAHDVIGLGLLRPAADRS